MALSSVIHAQIKKASTKVMICNDVAVKDEEIFYCFLSPLKSSNKPSIERTKRNETLRQRHRRHM